MRGVTTVAMMLLVVVLLALSQAVSAKGAYAPLNFKSLCDNLKINLTQRHELLSPDLKPRVGVDCPPHVVFALNELRNLLSLSETGLCSMDRAQRIRDFYQKYLDTSKDKESRDKKDSTGVKKKREKEQLATSFRRFAIAYGMRVSNVCKWAMFDALIKDDERFKTLLRTRDLKQLGSIARPGGTLSVLIDELNEPGEILLPSDLLAMMRASETTPIERMYIQSKYTTTIKRIQTVCAKRFRPVYEPIILPLTVLASVGFNYRDLEFKAVMKNGTYADRIRQWSRVVFLCEGMKMVEPVDLLEDGNDAGRENVDNVGKVETGNQLAEEQQEAKRRKAARVIGVLTKEEAEEVKAKLAERGSQAIEFPDIQRVEFKFTVDQKYVPGLILNKTDSRLMKAVERVKTSRTKLGRVKGKMTRRALVSLKQNLLAGRIKLVLSAPAKAMWRRLMSSNKAPESADEPNGEALARLEEMTELARKAEFKQEPHEVVEFVLVNIIILVLLGAVCAGLFYAWFAFLVFISVPGG